MGQRKYKTSSGYIEVVTGSEGPRHDPYSYTEWRVKRPGKPVVIYHKGLGDYVQYGERGKRHFKDVADLFKRWTKWTPRIVGLAISIVEKRRVKRCIRETGHHPDEIAAMERSAGWDPNP